MIVELLGKVIFKFTCGQQGLMTIWQAITDVVESG